MSTLTSGSFRISSTGSWMFAWTVEIHSKDRYIRRNPFSFKGHYVHLKLTKFYGYCKVELCTPPSFPSLSKYDMIVRVETKNKTPLDLSNNEAVVPYDKTYWIYSEDQILAKYPDFRKDGGILRFLVCNVDPPKGHIVSLVGASEDLARLFPLLPSDVGPAGRHTKGFCSSHRTGRVFPTKGPQGIPSLHSEAPPYCAKSLQSQVEGQSMERKPSQPTPAVGKFQTKFGRESSKQILEVGKFQSQQAFQTSEKSVQTLELFNDVSSLERLSSDLSALLKDQDSGPDLELLCGKDHSIKVHKNIVSARAKVISAMLNSDMSEGRTGRIEIKDMSSEVFDQFVHYLYAGKLPDLNEDSARGLYEAGDQYEVPSLMRRCKSFLLENMRLENVCELLVLADAHGDQEFKERAIEFIVEHEVFLQDDHWLPFQGNYPKLSNEVLHRFCKLQRKK